MFHHLVPVIQSLRLVRCITCLEVLKSRKKITHKQNHSFPKTTSTHWESSTTKQLNGLWDNALVMYLSQEHIILHVKLARTECLYSVDVIHQTKDTTILFISSYVIYSFYVSYVPMVSTTKSKIHWTTKECHVQDWRTITKSLPLND